MVALGENRDAVDVRPGERFRERRRVKFAAHVRDQRTRVEIQVNLPRVLLERFDDGAGHRGKPSSS